MMSKSMRFLSRYGVLALGLLLVASGCNDKPVANDPSPAEQNTADPDKPKSTDTSPEVGPAQPATNDGAPPAKPPALPGSQLSEVNVDVPENATPEELVEILQGFAKQRFKPGQEIAYQAIQAARVKAAEQLLANPEATVEQRDEGINAKHQGLRNLFGATGDKQYFNDMLSFLAGLRKSEVEHVRDFATHTHFMLIVDRLKEEGAGQADSAIAELNSALADPDKSVQYFFTSQHIVPVLNSIGEEDKAYEAMRSIGQAYMTSAEPQVAMAAKELLALVELRDAGFEEKQNAALEKDTPEARAEVITLLTEAMNKDASATAFQFSAQLAEVLERQGYYPEAVKLYESIHKVYSEHETAEMAEQATKTVNGASKRIGLIGKPFQVTGTTKAGAPLDWSNYQGKVVLVDFWATWCPPCLEEIPNVRKLYDAYHDKGFEVVGINTDHDPKRIENFFKSNEFPWATVLSGLGGNETETLSQQCGVETIPFMFIIGRDGTVVDIHTRGDRLTEVLQKLLGPVEGVGAAPVGRPGPVDQFGPVAEPKTYFVSAPSEEETEELDLPDVNPYRAGANLSTADLVDYLFRMEDKPQILQSRDGFSEAMINAADRILAAKDATPVQVRLATLTKFRLLHKMASFENEEADAQLVKFVDQSAGSEDKQIAEEVAFLQLERKALNAGSLPLDQVEPLLEELHEYFSGRELGEKHLRLASSTVKLINRFDDPNDLEKSREYGELREKYFSAFGTVFSKSKHKVLAAYGRKLSKSPGGTESELVGKQLEMAGTTALGAEFDWKSYRGKVVLVDFWASWCGPCRAEMPHVKKLYDDLQERGLEVVGVNLDRDPEAMAKFIAEMELPWTNIAGDGARDISNTYGVRGIPTIMLVDAEGKVVMVGHQSGPMLAKINELLPADQ